MRTSTIHVNFFGGSNCSSYVLTYSFTCGSCIYEPTVSTWSNSSSIAFSCIGTEDGACLDDGTCSDSTLTHYNATCLNAGGQARSCFPDGACFDGFTCSDVSFTCSCWRSCASAAFVACAFRLRHAHRRAKNKLLVSFQTWLFSFETCSFRFISRRSSRCDILSQHISCHLCCDRRAGTPACCRCCISCI
jgi:hypothetical protein